MQIPSNLTKESNTESINTADSDSNEVEIGLAISHYHHKLGPQFAEISFDFSKFDKTTQYNLLQDSISTRCKELMLFVKDLFNRRYNIFVKKIKIEDPHARGGVQRYALIILVPSRVNDFSLDIEQMVDDFKDDLYHGGISLSEKLDKWHNIINKNYTKNDEKEDEFEMKILSID